MGLYDGFMYVMDVPTDYAIYNKTTDKMFMTYVY